MPYAAKNIMKILDDWCTFAYLTSKRATQVFFVGLLYVLNKLYHPIYNSLEVLSIFVLGKRSPCYLPEDFTEMAFVGKTRKLGNSSIV